MSEAPRKIAAVKFGFSDKTYDYLVPDGLDLDPGTKVIVETKRGEATVEVVEIKAESDLVEKFILRIAEPDLRTDEERAAKYANGKPKFSKDRTLLDDKGNRSIFDDIDQ